MAKKQQGFTIIELVVVILLLGILAATALPRFMDVTEEAHDAAFDGSVGGFSTGVALFRAQWVGNGQSQPHQPVEGFNGLLVAPGFSAGTWDPALNAGAGGWSVASSFASSASGYPYGRTPIAGFDDLSAQHCADVFQNVLQAGSASVNAVTAAMPAVGADLAAFDAAIDTALTSEDSADFQVFLVSNLPIDSGVPTGATSGPVNHADNVPACAYVYTAEPGNLDRSFVYVPWTGEISRHNELNDLRDRLQTAPIPSVP
ncbi:MAG TPA: type II secretion system protein [Pseudohongiella sp.]|nr:type II secretion system protein [Pseudohongiella sp.]